MSAGRGYSESPATHHLNTHAYTTQLSEDPVPLQYYSEDFCQYKLKTRKWFTTQQQHTADVQNTMNGEEFDDDDQSEGALQIDESGISADDRDDENSRESYGMTSSALPFEQGSKQCALPGDTGLTGQTQAQIDGQMSDSKSNRALSEYDSGINSDAGSCVSYSRCSSTSGMTTVNYTSSLCTSPISVCSASPVPIATILEENEDACTMGESPTHHRDSPHHHNAVTMTTGQASDNEGGYGGQCENQRLEKGVRIASYDSTRPVPEQALMKMSPFYPESNKTDFGTFQNHCNNKNVSGGVMFINSKQITTDSFNNTNISMINNGIKQVESNIDKENMTEKQNGCLLVNLARNGQEVHARFPVLNATDRKYFSVNPQNAASQEVSGNMRIEEVGDNMRRLLAGGAEKKDGGGSECGSEAYSQAPSSSAGELAVLTECEPVESMAKMCVCVPTASGHRVVSFPVLKMASGPAFLPGATGPAFQPVNNAASGKQFGYSRVMETSETEVTGSGVDGGHFKTIQQTSDHFENSKVAAMVTGSSSQPDSQTVPMVTEATVSRQGARNSAEMLSLESFSRLAGIRIDPNQKNTLVTGFGMAGLSMMKANQSGSRNIIRAGSREETGSVVSAMMDDAEASSIDGRVNPNPDPSKAITDWQYLSQVQQAQKAEICERTREAACCEPAAWLACDICADRATGLHYGIVSCEGCKGFFKRTVQNRRVYTCIAEGACEVTKLRRNRCQFCRFKKCLQKGMIMAAVREDRMPGGRNSGAVYNLYKVKRRHSSAQRPRRSASSRASTASWSSVTSNSTATTATSDNDSVMQQHSLGNKRLHGQGSLDEYHGGRRKYNAAGGGHSDRDSGAVTHGHSRRHDVTDFHSDHEAGLRQYGAGRRAGSNQASVCGGRGVDYNSDTSTQSFIANNLSNIRIHAESDANTTDGEMQSKTNQPDVKHFNSKENISPRKNPDLPSRNEVVDNNKKYSMNTSNIDDIIRRKLGLGSDLSKSYQMRTVLKSEDGSQISLSDADVTGNRVHLDAAGSDDCFMIVPQSPVLKMAAPGHDSAHPHHPARKATFSNHPYIRKYAQRDVTAAGQGGHYRSAADMQMAAVYKLHQQQQQQLYRSGHIDINKCPPIAGRSLRFGFPQMESINSKSEVSQPPHPPHPAPVDVSRFQTLMKDHIAAKKSRHLGLERLQNRPQASIVPDWLNQQQCGGSTVGEGVIGQVTDMTRHIVQQSRPASSSSSVPEQHSKQAELVSLNEAKEGERSVLNCQSSPVIPVGVAAHCEDKVATNIVVDNWSSYQHKHHRYLDKKRQVVVVKQDETFKLTNQESVRNDSIGPSEIVDKKLTIEDTANNCEMDDSLHEKAISHGLCVDDSNLPTHKENGPRSDSLLQTRPSRSSSGQSGTVSPDTNIEMPLGEVQSAVVPESNNIRTPAVSRHSNGQIMRISPPSLSNHSQHIRPAGATNMVAAGTHFRNIIQPQQFIPSAPHYQKEQIVNRPVPFNHGNNNVGPYGHSVEFNHHFKQSNIPTPSPPSVEVMRQPHASPYSRNSGVFREVPCHSKQQHPMMHGNGQMIGQMIAPNASVMATITRGFPPQNPSAFRCTVPQSLTQPQQRGGIPQYSSRGQPLLLSTSANQKPHRQETHHHDRHGYVHNKAFPPHSSSPSTGVTHSTVGYPMSATSNSLVNSTAQSRGLSHVQVVSGRRVDRATGVHTSKPHSVMDKLRHSLPSLVHFNTRTKIGEIGLDKYNIDSKTIDKQFVDTGLGIGQTDSNTHLIASEDKHLNSRSGTDETHMDEARPFCTYMVERSEHRVATLHKSVPLLPRPCEEPAQQRSHPVLKRAASVQQHLAFTGHTMSQQHTAANMENILEPSRDQGGSVMTGSADKTYDSHVISGGDSTQSHDHHMTSVNCSSGGSTSDTAGSQVISSEGNQAARDDIALSSPYRNQSGVGLQRQHSGNGDQSQYQSQPLAIHSANSSQDDQQQASKEDSGNNKPSYEEPSPGHELPSSSPGPSATSRSPGPSGDRGKCKVLLIKQLMNWEDFAGGLTKQTLSTNICVNMADMYSNLGDEIVCEIVRWIKKLPFYSLISLSVHTQILQKRWHQILLLSTSVNQAWEQMEAQKHNPRLRRRDIQQQLVNNLQKVHTFMTDKLERSIKFDELFAESGDVVEKMTKLTSDLVDMGVSREEYVCFKVMLLLSGDGSIVERVHQCYQLALKEFLQQRFPHDPHRYAKMKNHVLAIQACADILLEQKLIYMPFLLNSQS